MSISSVFSPSSVTAIGSRRPEENDEDDEDNEDDGPLCWIFGPDGNRQIKVQQRMVWKILFMNTDGVWDEAAIIKKLRTLFVDDLDNIPDENAVKWVLVEKGLSQRCECKNIQHEC